MPAQQQQPHPWGRSTATRDVAAGTARGSATPWDTPRGTLPTGDTPWGPGADLCNVLPEMGGAALGVLLWESLTCSSRLVSKKRMIIGEKELLR